MLGERLMRCKGVWLLDGPRTMIVQGVGQHVEVTPAPAGAAGTGGSFMCFIGVGAKPTFLAETFRACAAP